jgi:hypothetical protein
MATAQLTNAGLNQLAGALLGTQGASAAPQITWVALGTGAGLLGTALVSGTNYTTLNLQSGCNTAIANGTSLTIVNGSNSQVVTLSAAVAAGDTTLNVTSFNANFSYPVNSGVVNTPAATDIALQNEVFRKALSSGVPGGSAGESLLVLYIAPTDSPGVTFLEIGWWAGNASATPASGVLVARAIYWYPHTGSDSASAQLDTTV